MTLLVLAGGLSLEREVSLDSGRRLTQALRADGIDTTMCDADDQLPQHLRSVSPTAAINVLHGQRGEDGTVAELLSLCNIPYIGQTPAAARLASDKATAKAIATLNNLRTPEGITLPYDAFQDYGAEKILNYIVERIQLPLVVKPIHGGSGIGLSIVREATELRSAFQSAFACDKSVLIEKYIKGIQIAVTIVDDLSHPRLLPAVQVQPKTGQYDYPARYSAGRSLHLLPPVAPDAHIENVLGAALRIHRGLGMRHVTRTDFILEPDGTAQFLEITGSPSLTATSLAALAIDAAGEALSRTYTELIKALLLHA